jgi:hypothetical protein
MAIQRPNECTSQEIYEHWLSGIAAFSILHSFAEETWDWLLPKNGELRMPQCLLRNKLALQFI